MDVLPMSSLVDQTLFLWFLTVHACIRFLLFLLRLAFLFLGREFQRYAASAIRYNIRTNTIQFDDHEDFR